MARALLCSLLPEKSCHSIEWSCSMTTRQPTRSCFERQFHLESWAGTPQDQGQLQSFPSGHPSASTGEGGYSHRLCHGVRPTPLAGAMFTIADPTQGGLQRKTERGSNSTGILSEGSYSALAAGINWQLPILASASCPINLEKLRPPFSSLKMILRFLLVAHR